MANFETKMKVLKKLKENGIDDISKLNKLTTREMIKIVGAGSLETLLDIQDHAKDLYSYLMKDA